MKKTGAVIFIIACLVVCLIPSVGMFFKPNAEAIGNEESSALPSIMNEDGSFNTNILSDLGDYFEQHFAFRSEIITTDAVIQSKVFGVSNLDSVIAGKDGWLYYASTLDDYMGQNALSEQQIDGIVHNLTLVQQRVEDHDAKFLFTVAPNKNTLYPEHMPSYYHADESAARNRDLLNAALAHSSVDYCDLFSVFEKQDETLYFARDSHWNNKGALLAYNTILAKLEVPHDDFSSTTPSQREDFVGDLSKMIYPSSSIAELNYYYDAEGTYRYATDTSSVEEPLIRTNNDNAQGSLFMYRDSFGNALLPFFASAFGDAVFIKSFPIMLDLALEQYQPNDVVFEIAERNIEWFLTQPPLMRAPIIEAQQIDLDTDKSFELSVKESENSPLYLEVSGLMSEELKESSSPVYLFVSDDEDQGALYECYNLLTEQRQDAFLAYLDASDYEGLSTLSVSVVVRDGAGFKAIGSNTVNIER